MWLIPNISSGEPGVENLAEMDAADYMLRPPVETQMGVGGRIPVCRRAMSQPYSRVGLCVITYKAARTLKPIPFWCVNERTLIW